MTSAPANRTRAPETVAHHNGAARPAMAAPLLLPMSATSAEELRRTAGRLADWVTTRADGLALSDLAYTLARRRALCPVRTAVRVGNLDELTKALREIADGDAPHRTAVGQDDRGPVWVFSGPGSQWPGMGAGLLATEPVFAATVAETEPLIARESGFSVTAAMAAPETLVGADRIQPTLFSMQVAMAATMASLGVRPGAVIGHSTGEVAAAVVAGALSLQDGVRVTCRRSRLMSRVAGCGAMASVDLPAKQVLSELTTRMVTDVVLSVVTSPTSTVVGGATQTIRQLVAAWQQRGVPAREVPVDVASHSPQVDPILDELADALADLTPMTPTVPYYSATRYDPRDQPAWDAGYWVDNLRNTVRFFGAVKAALQDGYRVFAELAPHPLLTHAVEQTAGSLDMPSAALACMRYAQTPPHGLRELLADLYCAGAAMDFSVLFAPGRLVEVPLPMWTRHASAVSVPPQVRLPEEPERHVRQAEVSPAAQPRSADQRLTAISELRAELDALPREKRPALLRRLLTEQASVILRRGIDPDRPLSEYGLDSVDNLELRTRIETATGIRVKPTDITTVRALAERLCDEHPSNRSRSSGGDNVPSRADRGRVD